MGSVLGLVVAMAVEAAELAGRPGWRIIEGHYIKHFPSSKSAPEWVILRCGIGPERAFDGAQYLLRSGARALISLGLSGGLYPESQSGDLIVADRLLMMDGAITASVQTPSLSAEQACQLLRFAGLPVMFGSLISTRDAVLSPDRKAALFERFGALAVDMESVAVAQAAAHAGLPFFACRAVCDPVTQTIPLPFIAALSPDGSLIPRCLLYAILRKPALVGQLIALGRQSRIALKSLRVGWNFLLQSSFTAELIKS